MDTGVIYCNENLGRLVKFASESVDLVYLDPPFFSNRQYEVIWGDEAEVRSFEDRWQGGIQVYVGWMRDRVRELWRVLKPTGSLYLHCDWHASHYLKAMLDDVFGAANFRNEIIWKRSSAHSDSKQGARHFGRVTDTILFYAKSDAAVFHQPYSAYDPAYLARDYRRVDADGRRYRIDNIQGPGGAAKGNPYYEFLGVSRYWRYSRERMEELYRQGRIIQTRPGAVPQYKRYLDEMPGVPVQNLWTDIPVINNRSKERMGYPTQKPEALLERIILASSDEGDILLDPFAGCGTSIVAAHRLKRRWIGIDISPTAVELMRRRLAILGVTNVKLVDIPVSEQALRNLKPFEFQNWVIQRLNGTHSPRKSGDMGIDGYSFFLHEPIQVKQSDSVGRNVVDNFETAVQRSGKQKGCIVAFSFTKGAYEEAARAKQAVGLEIELLKVSDLLQGLTTLIAPVGGHRITSVPMPPPRPGNTLPSVEDLINSDLRAVTADGREIERAPVTPHPQDQAAPPEPPKPRKRRAAAG